MLKNDLGCRKYACNLLDLIILCFNKFNDTIANTVAVLVFWITNSEWAY